MEQARAAALPATPAPATVGATARRRRLRLPLPLPLAALASASASAESSSSAGRDVVVGAGADGKGASASTAQSLVAVSETGASAVAKLGGENPASKPPSKATLTIAERDPDQRAVVMAHFDLVMEAMQFLAASHLGVHPMILFYRAQHAWVAARDAKSAAGLRRAVKRLHRAHHASVLRGMHRLTEDITQVLLAMDEDIRKVPSVRKRGSSSALSAVASRASADGGPVRSASRGSVDDVRGAGSGARGLPLTSQRQVQYGTTVPTSRISTFSDP